jgi:tRNA (guanine-N7-)-methyltransferase
MKKELKNFQNNSLIRSFGRIKSRKLSDHKVFLLNSLFTDYQIKNFSSNSQINCLEIGFGFGDFLFEKSKNNPDKLFFGFEPHINGVVNLLAKLEKYPLKNLKISCNDVRISINSFDDNFFDDIYILFPDPWPKSKHFKRRLINEKFLDNLLANKMKKGAKLTIASDHDSYKTWIFSTILRSKKFIWLANSKEDWQNFPNDWIETKYQKKAALEGRKSIIITLIKNV